MVGDIDVIREIQYLRGIAAMMVVLYHTIPQLQRMGYRPSLNFECLSYGVDIFFVISGFIMTIISIDNQQYRWDFIKNRIIRIVPVYWLLTSFTAVLGVSAPFLLQSTQVDLAQYIKSLLFIPYIHPIMHSYLPLLQPGWTLNYEMYFYVIFALFLGVRGDAKYFFMIVTLSALTIFIGQCLDFVPVAFYGNWIILEFCFGILLGYAYTRHVQVFSIKFGAPIGIVIFVGGFIQLFSGRSISPDYSRLLIAGIPSLLIVSGALFLSKSEIRIESRLLKSIGDSSYSLYLLHGILMSALGQLFRKIVIPFAGSTTYFVFPVIALATCAVASYIFYITVELKLTRQMRRIFD